MKKKILFWLFVVVTLCLIGVFLVLNYGYSTGNRSGKLVKLSKVGYLIKTYEGTLDLGSGDQLTWQFSVHNDRIGDQLMEQTGKNITLDYKEHLFKLFYGSKYNVVSWQQVRGGENDFFCRFVNVVVKRGDVVEALRPLIIENDPELLNEIRRCQNLNDE